MLTKEELEDLNKIEELVRQITLIVEPKHYNNSFYATLDCECMGMRVMFKALKNKT